MAAISQKTLIARFMGPTRGPPGDDRTQVGPMLAPWNLLSGDISRCIVLNKKSLYLIRISLEFVPKSPIDNKSALVQVMAWRRTGAKPLHKPMLTQFTDAYLRHEGRWFKLSRQIINWIQMQTEAVEVQQKSLINHYLLETHACI